MRAPFHEDRALLPFEANFAKFRNLWRTDDAEWVEARRRDWAVVASNGGFNVHMKGRRGLVDVERFFVYGIEVSVLTTGTLSAVIDGQNRFLLTPFETGQQARELFEALHSASGMQESLSEFPYSASHVWNGLEWCARRVRAFCDGVLGNSYAEIERPKMRVLERATKEMTVVAPSRGIWHRSYASRATAFLQGKLSIDYCYVVDTIAYFVSMLAVMDHRKEPIADGIAQLIGVTAKAVRDDSLTGVRRQFALDLWSAFNAEQAPTCVRRALSNSSSPSR